MYTLNALTDILNGLIPFSNYYKSYKCFSYPHEIPQFPDALSAASLNSENPIMATAGAIVIGVI